MVRSRSIIATPPGATIKEQLADRGMSQKEFAVRIEMSEKHISRLIHGEVQLTPEVALRLEMVLGTPAYFWNNLEAIYREKLLRAAAENEMDEEIALSEKVPYQEMAECGWIPEAQRVQERVVYLRKYFEVVRLGLLKEELFPLPDAEKREGKEQLDYTWLAWVQKARLEARRISTVSFNAESLKGILSEIRAMTVMDPDTFCPILTERLAGCGVAAVFLPHLRESSFYEAAFLEGGRVIMGLTVAGRRIAEFWFGLAQQISCILEGKTSRLKGLPEKKEGDRGKKGRMILLPEDHYFEFVGKGDFSGESLTRFAKEIGIHTGIVAESLQEDGYIEKGLYSDLNPRYSHGL